MGTARVTKNGTVEVTLPTVEGARVEVERFYPFEDIWLGVDDRDGRRALVSVTPGEARLLAKALKAAAKAVESTT